MGGANDENIEFLRVAKLRPREAANGNPMANELHMMWVTLRAGRDMRDSFRSFF